MRERNERQTRPLRDVFTLVSAAKGEGEREEEEEKEKRSDGRLPVTQVFRPVRYVVRYARLEQ